MSVARVSLQKQSRVAVLVLLVAACAVQSEPPSDSVDVPISGGVGGSDMAGTSSTGTGGSMDAMMGVGGTAAGVTGMGTGGTGMAGKPAGGAGSGAKAGAGGGGKAGSAAGMPGTAGRVGSAGTATMGSGGRVGAGGGGGAGRAAAGTTGAGGRVGTGGRTGAAGTGGMGAAGRSAGGSAGTGAMNCVTTLMPGDNSGMLGSSEVCFDITANMAGWQVSNAGTRVVTVNGKVVDVTGSNLAVPPAVDGHRIIDFGAGAPTYTAWGYW